MDALESMHYGMSKTDDQRPIVLVTTVDIGSGRSDKIELRQGDKPEDAARAFCELHNIPASVVGPLTEHIMDNLRKAGTKLDNVRENVGKIAAQLQKCLEEEEEEDKEEPANPAPEPYAMHPMAMKPMAGQKLSFDDPSEKLYEQLTAKLMPCDDNGRLLSVSASMGLPLSSRAAHSNRTSMSMASDRDHRKSHSAETSPRVHHRLYKQAADLRSKQEAKRRAAAHELAASMTINRSSMSWISQEMMKDRSHGPFDNYGEMLYAEGLEAAANRKAKAATIRAERSARELDGATFTPEITRLAAALWAGDDVEAQPAWARLSANKRNKTLERIHEMKATREQQELKECTFQPRINRQSQAMMSERTHAQQALQTTTHHQLFADAVRRQQKMEALQTWLPDDVTFAPAINKSPAAEAALRRSLESMGSRAPRGPAAGVGASQDGSIISGPSVVDRLYVNMEKTKAKLEERRAVLHGDIDPATGRSLFQPEVGRAPRGPTATRNRDGLPIGEHLYMMALEAAEKKGAVVEAEKQADREAASKSHSTALSHKLYDKLRAKRFGQIFEYLDSECQGALDLVALVRAPTGHMDNLDNEVREDVEVAAALHADMCGVPLLPEPAAPGAPAPAPLPPAAPVDLPAFSALMEEALKARRKPRAYLVPSPSAKQAPSHTFQPAINKRSKELAARLRPAELAAHEVLHHTAEAIRSKLEAARREASLAALADCTFAPQLNPTMAGGQPVEGRAMRAALSAIAAGGSARSGGSAAAAGGGSGSTATSPGVPAPAGAGSRSGAFGPTAPAPAPPATQQHHFAALEAEVQQALQGVDVASARLGKLEQRSGSGTPPAALPTGPATAMDLLDMLTSSPQSLDSAADHAVIDQLHRFLVTEAQSQGQAVMGVAAAHISTAGRRSSKDPSVNTANMFVVPAHHTNQWE